MSAQVIEQTECSVEVDFLDASNMAFRSAVFRGVGGFNEVFGELGEYSEPELCIRINSAGYSLVFNPKATVYHYPGSAKKHASPKCTYARGKNFGMFIRKNPHSKLALSLILYIVFFNAYHLSKGLTEKNPSWFNCIRGFTCGIRKKAR